jgi:hypothetical protein
MDLNDWLERHGLTKYAGLFAEHAIGLDAERGSRHRLRGDGLAGLIAGGYLRASYGRTESPARVAPSCRRSSNAANVHGISVRSRSQSALARCMLSKPRSS